MGKKNFGNQKETKRKECKISSDREGKKVPTLPKTQNQIMHTTKLENITKLFFCAILLLAIVITCEITIRIWSTSYKLLKS